MIEGITKGIELLEKVIKLEGITKTLKWHDFNVVTEDRDKYLVVIHGNMPKIVALLHLENPNDGPLHARVHKYFQESSGKMYELEHHPYSKWAYLELP